MSSQSNSTQTAETLTVKSPFSVTIEWFDNEEYFPDTEFIIPGVEKPLRLHAPVLVRASQVFVALLKAKANTYGRYDPETRRLEWMFDRSANDMNYRNCLVKWLRFCYGEDQTFEVDELGASLVTLLQLQLKCENSMKEAITTRMMEMSKKDISYGCRMLIDCVNENEESQQNSIHSISFCISKAVLCKENLIQHSDIVVNNCLMLLPYCYLDDAEYGEAHSELSEFNIRMRYVEIHAGSLSMEEKRDILSKCKAEELGSDELKKLSDLSVLDPESLIELSFRTVHSYEMKLSSAMNTISELKKAIAKREELMKQGEETFFSLDLESVLRSSSFTSSIPTGHSDAVCGGAIYDNTRNIIVSVSSDSNNCRDLFVTHLDSGVIEVKTNVVSFSAYNDSPVFDGVKYVYFMERADVSGGGKQFGRVDLDTFAFEALPSFPQNKYAAPSGGCFGAGYMYTVADDGGLWSFHLHYREWGFTGISVPKDNDSVCGRLLNDPQNLADSIYWIGREKQHGLYRINLEKGSVTLESATPVAYSPLREALFVRVGSEDFIIVTALKDGAWYCYSSRHKS